MRKVVLASGASLGLGLLIAWAGRLVELWGFPHLGAGVLVFGTGTLIIGLAYLFGKARLGDEPLLETGHDQVGTRCADKRLTQSPLYVQFRDDFELLVQQVVRDFSYHEHQALAEVSLVISDARCGGSHGLLRRDAQARSSSSFDSIVLFREDLVGDFGQDLSLVRTAVAEVIREGLSRRASCATDKRHRIRLSASADAVGRAAWLASRSHD